MARPDISRKAPGAPQRAQRFAVPARHFVDYELLHARKIAFLGALGYAAVVFLVVNAAFGWSLWPLLGIVAPMALVAALVLAMLPSRD